MLIPLLRYLGLFLAAGMYLAGIYYWAYRGKAWVGLFSVILLFPALLWLSLGGHWVFLRGVPILGVTMFIHASGKTFLRSIPLLWFTSLTVMVIQASFALIGLWR